MNRQKQIFNWLRVGFRQSPDRLSEMFYYDKRDNEFFSILVMDYFMLDENFDIVPDVTTSYSLNTVKIIADRIKRIENNDPAIFSLPRLGELSNTDYEEFIPQKIDAFLNLNSIDLKTVSIWEIEEEASISIDLKKDVESEVKRPWWKIWK
jgi:hypothetical protein